MKISAVLVTKGDVPKNIRLMNSLAIFDEVIIWDNSKAVKDVKVFGRFAGAFIARNDLIYVQDDDCVIPTRTIQAYAGIEDRIVCNMPEDRRPEYRTGCRNGISLIGWGTVFHKSKMNVFNEYFKHFPLDDLFMRECDRVFSYMNRRYFQLIDIGLEHLNHALGNDRMGKEQRHGDDLVEISRRLHSIEAMHHYEDAHRRLGLGVTTV